MYIILFVEVEEHVGEAGEWRSPGPCFRETRKKKESKMLGADKLSRSSSKSLVPLATSNLRRSSNPDISGEDPPFPPEERPKNDDISQQRDLSVTMVIPAEELGRQLAIEAGAPPQGSRRPSGLSDLAAAGRREGTGGAATGEAQPGGPGSSPASPRGPGVDPARRRSDSAAIVRATRSIESLSRLFAMPGSPGSGGTGPSSGNSSRRGSFSRRDSGAPRYAVQDGGSLASGESTQSRRSSEASGDYRDMFEMTYHHLTAECQAVQAELLELKVRLLEPLALRGRASLSILHFKHLRSVPPSAFSGPSRRARLRIASGPPHEWTCGWRFSGITLALEDDEGLPISGWAGDLSSQAFLLDGVGNVITEAYDYSSALLGSTARLVGSTVSFTELCVKIPSSLSRCGWFQLGFVLSGYAVEPVLSDRFAVAEARVPRDPFFTYDMATAESIAFGSPHTSGSSSSSGATRAVRRGVTPLHVAVARGRLELISLLLDKGDSPRAMGPRDITPLHCAAFLGLEDVARTLLGHTVEIDAASSDGYTALHLAMIGGHAATAALLLSSGGDPLVPTAQGFLPCHLAARFNSPAMMALLPPDALAFATRGERQTAFHVAAFHGATDVAPILLKAGCNPAAKALRGWSAAHLAALGGSLAFLEYLGSLPGPSSAHLLDAALDGSGVRPIHIAALRAHEDLVSFLIEKRCDVASPTANGWTTAHFAALSGDKDTFETVVEHSPQLQEGEDVASLASMFIFDSFTAVKAPFSAPAGEEASARAELARFFL
jgi:ankyrin repeat protein